MTADLCCESTGRYLAEHGYHVACLSDASGGKNLAAQRRLSINYPLIGNAVLEDAEFLAAIDGAGRAHSRGRATPSTGRIAASSAQSTRISLPTAETTGYLLLKRGVIFDRYTPIPLAAVTRRR